MILLVWQNLFSRILDMSSSVFFVLFFNRKHAVKSTGYFVTFDTDATAMKARPIYFATLLGAL